jgi:hypothetical protein
MDRNGRTAGHRGVKYRLGQIERGQNQTPMSQKMAIPARTV